MKSDDAACEGQEPAVAEKRTNALPRGTRHGGQGFGDRRSGLDLSKRYKRRHPETRNRMLWLMADSDDTRRWNAQLLCRLKYEQGTAPSYLYFFDWQSPVHNNRMGSYHTLDIPFVFYNMDIGASK